MGKLNDNEVKEVAKMQQKIDAYEAFILAVSFLVRGNDNVNYPIFARTELDKQMNCIWRYVKQTIKDYEGKKSSETT